MKYKRGFIAVAVTLFIVLAAGLVAAGAYRIHEDRQHEQEIKIAIQKMQDENAKFNTELGLKTEQAPAPQPKTSNVSSGWSTYKDDFYSISFDYPTYLKPGKIEDWTNIGSINKGWAVPFTSADGKGGVEFRLDIDDGAFAHPDPVAALNELYTAVTTLKPTPLDPPGKPFAKIINLTNGKFLEWGVKEGDYAYLIYTKDRTYTFSLKRPKVYSSGYLPTGYKQGSVSDEDFLRMVQSLVYTH